MEAPAHEAKACVNTSNVFAARQTSNWLTFLRTRPSPILEAPPTLTAVGTVSTNPAHEYPSSEELSIKSQGNDIIDIATHFILLKSSMRRNKCCCTIPSRKGERHGQRQQSLLQNMHPFPAERYIMGFTMFSLACLRRGCQREIGSLMQLSPQTATATVPLQAELLGVGQHNRVHCRADYTELRVFFLSSVAAGVGERF